MDWDHHALTERFLALNALQLLDDEILLLQNGLDREVHLPGSARNRVSLVQSRLGCCDLPVLHFVHFLRLREMKYTNIHNLVRGWEEDALNRFPYESADTKHDGKEENHQ